MISIYLDDVSFQYRGAPHIVDQMSHSFCRGSVTAITGPSGSGKSTLLYVMGTMLLPTAGRIEMLGVPVPSKDHGRAKLRAKSIGFVFQDAVLDQSRSVLDNIMEGALYGDFDAEAARCRADALMERFGVELRSSARPVEISGGQAQRVALCRALIKSPPILLADEPTGNLDRSTSDLVWGALAQVASEGGTVVVATHDQRLTSLADHVLSLS